MNVLHSTTSDDEKRTDRDLAIQWNSIHWNDVKAHVNRLQTRLAKAVVERKWNLALESQTKLLFFSYSRPIIGL